MSDPFQPDYPQWVRQIFEPGFKCTRCCHRLQLADLVSVGVSRPPAGTLLNKKPRGRAFADCAKCFKPFCFEVEAPLTEIVEAVNEFYEHLDMFGDPRANDPEKPKKPSDDNQHDTSHLGKGLWSMDEIIRRRGKGESGSPPVPPPDDINADSEPPGTAGKDPRLPKSPLGKQWDAERKRHKDSLKDMPTDEEVQTFLKQLKRTSFKRSSKGFRHWMRQFGIDIDQSGPPTGGGPSDGE